MVKIEEQAEETEQAPEKKEQTEEKQAGQKQAGQTEQTRQTEQTEPAGQNISNPELPDVEKAAEMSIKNQQEKTGRDHPSWNIAEEEKTLHELMNEDADKIYSQGSKKEEKDNKPE